jgi:hypothetical protein
MMKHFLSLLNFLAQWLDPDDDPEDPLAALEPTTSSLT